MSKYSNPFVSVTKAYERRQPLQKMPNTLEGEGAQLTAVFRPKNGRIKPIFVVHIFLRLENMWRRNFTFRLLC